MKKWPEDNKPAGFDDLVLPVVQTVKAAYWYEKKPLKFGLTYNGLPLTSCEILATSLTISEKLSAENMKYDEEEQGREPLEVLIGIAVQLGIEQGLRISKERYDRWLFLAKSPLDTMMEWKP